MNRIGTVLAILSAGLALACGSSGGGVMDPGVDPGPADVMDAVDTPADIAEFPVDLLPDTPMDTVGDSVSDVPQDLPADDGPDLMPEVSPDEGPDPAPDVPSDVLPDLAPDAPPPVAYGFDVRVPGEKNIDHVCRVAYKDVIDGYLYVQASEVSCGMMMGCTYKVDGAWTSIGGQVAVLAGVTYDYGGNHHNDSISFTYGGKQFRLYHSYFGFGWRACTPMDCMQVGPGGSEQDGCVEGERSLPVQCVEVCPNGTVLPPKDFPACPKDPPFYLMFEDGCAAGTW